MKHTIDTLSRQDIEQGPLPLRALLENSFYYPAAGHDGCVIRDCNTHGRSLGIRSFIYSDYVTGPEAYLEKENDFRGYHVFGSRALAQSDFTIRGWQPVIAPGVHPKRYMKYREYWKPFAHWTVYERDADQSEEHGPERFSLLYIGGEGVATYQALYWTHRIVPAAITIIQPGSGWGFNWTNFWAADGPLAWTVNHHPVGKPAMIYLGKYGYESDKFCWPGYRPSVRHVHNRYPGFKGDVTYWELIETNDEA